MSAVLESILAVCIFLERLRFATSLGSGSVRLLRSELGFHSESSLRDSSSSHCNNIDDIVAAARPANATLNVVRVARPSKALLEDWRCNETLGFCQDFRASKFVTEGRLKPAFAPHGHVGDRNALHERLRDAWKSQRLSLAVFGNSITCGAHCSKGQWALRLVELLEKGGILQVPKQVEMQIHATGGATTSWGISRIGELATKLAKVHVVFVDFGMSDTRTGNGQEGSHSPYHTKMFISLLRTLPSPPAVVYIETFSYDIYSQFTHRQPWCPETIRRHLPQKSSDWDLDPCMLDVRCFPHWEALEELDVPVISYFDAVCAALPRKDNFVVDGHMRYWHPGDNLLQGSQHPSCDAHEVIAHLTAEFLIHSIHLAATTMSSTSSRSSQVLGLGNSSLSNPMNVSFDCLHWPVTIYETTFDSDTMRRNDIRVHTEHAHGLRGPRNFPAFVQGDTWIYAEDVKGKPGWISQPGVISQITFPIWTEMGHVIIEYLSTYSADVGTVTCVVGNGPAEKLNARITGHISVSAFQTLNALPLQGEHNLTCRSDGTKFKLLSIRTC